MLTQKINVRALDNMSELERLRKLLDRQLTSYEYASGTGRRVNIQCKYSI